MRKRYRREIDRYSAFCEADGVTLTGLAGYLRERGFKRGLNDADVARATSNEFLG